ncbi:hypothetical protein BD414DRAFT_411737 [Trametes punicea]|nr:hypothetical protein BD414DRAFT_411737 [Trametes punicea]
MSNTIPPSAPAVAVSPPPVPEMRKDRFRAVGLLVKKQGMTDDEFYRYWHMVHGPLFAGMEISKKNLLKYEQHHYTTAFDEAFKAVGFDLVPYRGLAIFEAESYEKLLEVFGSEEYKRVIVPDEAKFLDRPKTGFFIGPIVDYIDRTLIVSMAKHEPLLV